MATPHYQERWLSDDENVTLRVGGTDYVTAVGTLRRAVGSKFCDIFSEDKPTKMPSDATWVYDRNPAVFSVVLDYLRTGKMVVPSGISEASVAAELEFWKVGSLQDVEVMDSIELDEEDTESDSPARHSRSHFASRTARTTGHLDATYSMTGQEMFGRAVTLVRQEDAIAKVADIQHGLALLRELLTVDSDNVSFMYYMSYGLLRLGKTSEAAYWSDKILRSDPANLAANSLRTLINDKRSTTKATGAIVVAAAVTLLGGLWWLRSKSQST